MKTMIKSLIVVSTIIGLSGCIVPMPDGGGKKGAKHVGNMNTNHPASHERGEPHKQQDARGQ